MSHSSNAAAAPTTWQGVHSNQAIVPPALYARHAVAVGHLHNCEAFG